MQWSTGAKVWLWLVLVVNVLSCVSIALVLLIAPAAAIISLVLELILIAGVVLLLFRRQRIGFYLLCVCSVLSLIVNIISGTGIVRAIVSAVLFPLITYLVIKNQWNELA